MVDSGLRIELGCGSSAHGNLDEARERYTKANEIASRFDAGVNFQVAYDDGVVYADGYFYPCATNLLDVLNALDRADIYYDNIELPDSFDGSPIYKKLINRYEGSGVVVNLGYRVEKCRKWDKDALSRFMAQLDQYDEIVPKDALKLKMGKVARQVEKPLVIETRETERTGEMVCHTSSDGSISYGVILRIDEEEDKKTVWAVWERTPEDAAKIFEEVIDWIDSTPHGIHGLEYKKTFDKLASDMLKMGFNINWARDFHPMTECALKPSVTLPPDIKCPNCGETGRILVGTGRVTQWVGTSEGKRTYGKYKCLKCGTAFDVPEEDVKSAPRKRPLLEKGKGYVRVGPAKFIYLTEGIEINVPAIVLTGITAATIMGAVYAIFSRWQLTQKAKIIENYLMGKP